MEEGKDKVYAGNGGDRITWSFFFSSLFQKKEKSPKQNTSEKALEKKKVRKKNGKICISRWRKAFSFLFTKEKWALTFNLFFRFNSSNSFEERWSVSASGAQCATPVLARGHPMPAPKRVLQGALVVEAQVVRHLIQTQPWIVNQLLGEFTADFVQHLLVQVAGRLSGQFTYISHHEFF